MKKQLALILSLILAILLAGCAMRGAAPSRELAQPTVAPGARGGEPAQSGTGDVPQVTGEQYAQQQATTGQADVDPQTGLNRMVIYNANLALIVKDTLQAMDAARKIVQAAGGYIAESNSYRQDEQLRATITARVPSEKLTDTLDQLKKLALTVDSESLKGEDVTDQYTDLQSRLRNLEAAEQQYLDILTRAEKIDDVLAVQQRLTEIRGEIEQAKGRMDYLSKSAAFATITISLTPDTLAQPISIGGWRPQGTVRDAFMALVWALRALVTILIWTLICVLPVGLILGVPLYFGGRWARRRMRKPKAQAASQT